MDITGLTPAAMQKRIFEEPAIKQNLEKISNLKIGTLVISILAAIVLAAGIAAIIVFGAPVIGGVIVGAALTLSILAGIAYVKRKNIEASTKPLIEAKQQELQNELAQAGTDALRALQPSIARMDGKIASLKKPRTTKPNECAIQ